MEKFKQTTSDRVAKWQSNTPEAFLQWVQDIKPRVLQNNRYEVFQPTERQSHLIDQILKPASEPSIDTLTSEPVNLPVKRSHNARKARPSRKGKTPEPSTDQIKRQSSFQHNLSLLIEPRRHGKSTLFALICLWLFTSRKNTTLQVLGNTESHTRRVQFNTLKKIINNTPSLSKLIPEKNQFVFEIFFPAMGNVLQMSPGNNPSTSFGDRLDVLWVSDLHACADLQPFNAMQASLLDSQDSLCLIDSNVDSKGGPVHGIQLEAENDDTIFCHHTQYTDFDDFAEHAPVWIDRKKAKRLQKTVLEPDFLRDILGQRSDAVNALFSGSVIDGCKSSFKWPVENLQALVQGRAYKIGCGLDRSKSLLGSALGGDNSIITVVAKVASPKNEEPEIFIIDQINAIPNTANNIKKIILNAHKKYKIDNLTLEDYETMDLVPYFESQRIPCEVVSPHSTKQNQVFPELSRISRENRLFFPEDASALAEEMSTFSYRRAPRGEGFSFGHSTKKQHDDRIYSLAWAIYSLRSQIMNLYSLNSVNCTSKRPNKHLCFLMGGNQELFCSEQCEACQMVKEMYIQFLRYQFDSDVTLPEFFKTYVKLTGTRVYQAI
ncbi:MAG TPA: hypothetical protein PLS62_11205 [Desulfobacteraceae bacterium]|nr:hypothetical protein [Desulfobacteraceae bacterium]